LLADFHGGQLAHEVHGCSGINGRPHKLEHAIKLAHAHEAIHLGQLGDEVLAVPLGQATRNEHPHAMPGFGQTRFVIEPRENGLYGFSLGGVDEAAGVYQHRVEIVIRFTGCFVRSRNIHAFAGEQAGQIFVVDRVLITAKSYHSYAHDERIRRAAFQILGDVRRAAMILCFQK
jgi:hypothetical protein